MPTRATAHVARVSESECGRSSTQPQAAAIRNAECHGIRCIVFSHGSVQLSRSWHKLESCDPALAYHREVWNSSSSSRASFRRDAVVSHVCSELAVHPGFVEAVLPKGELGLRLVAIVRGQPAPHPRFDVGAKRQFETPVD